jgi:hypothetical protein
MVKLRNTSRGQRGVNVGGSVVILEPLQEREVDAEMTDAERTRIEQMGDIVIDGQEASDEDVFTGDNLADLGGEEGVRALGEQSVEEGRDPNAEGGVAASSDQLQPGQTMGQQAPNSGLVSADREAAIRAAMEGLTEGVDYTADGTPRVESINSAGSFATPVTAAERDEVWAKVQAEKA